MQAEIAHEPIKKRITMRWWFWVLTLFATYYLVVRAPMPLIQSWWQRGLNNWNDSLHRRHRMADWMLLTRSLNGLTRAEVVAKLGEPPPTDYSRDWSMVYILGSERGFISIDSEWLVLRLNEAGLVADARIVRD